MGRPSRAFASRYLDPTLREHLEKLTHLEEVPCVRGRAVVIPSMVGDFPVLLGWPNVMGRLESAHPDTASVAVIDGAVVGSSPAGYVSIVGVAGDSESFGRGVDRARNLAKRLTQIRGVASAHGPPDTPVFVVLLPVDPTSIGLPSGAGSFHGRYPELPGAIRVDATRVDDDDVATYAAELEAELKTGTGQQQ